MKIFQNPEKHLKDGLKASVSSKKRLLGTSAVTFLVFTFTVLSANPEYSLQMFSAGISYWPTAFWIRLLGVLSTSGYPGLLLTALFSALVGVTLTNTVIQFRMSKVSGDMLGTLPGFLAGGCASCGVGVLSILGFGGVLASLPFHGNLLRLGGVLLLLAVIINTGNPETCEI